MSTTIAQTILAQLGGVNVTERGEFEMIYGDRLAALFTEQTGFDTHL